MSAAGKMRGERNWEAGIVAAVGEEDNFGLVVAGPVEARPAVVVEGGNIERFLADQVVLRMVEVRIAAGLHGFIRKIPVEDWNILTEAILSWWSCKLSALNESPELQNLRG
jgi:hypothetical protein